MRRSTRRTMVFMLMTSVAVYLYDRMQLSNVTSRVQMGMYSIDLQDRDVIVLLDIPATGMTSLSHALMHDMVSEVSCFCPTGLSRCSCRNSNNNPWLFHAYNATGWVCGEHADFTTLTRCPIDYWLEHVGHDSRDYRRYALLTLLREPAARFISEWRHLVQEDTFYKNEPRLFRNASLELQKKGLPCWLGVQMSKMSLEQFLGCKENPAINRQTRMLANLTEVNKHSYHGDRYNNLLLASAVRTLESLPFFGVYDHPSDTQMLFETTLGLRFSKPLRLNQDAEYPPTNARDFPGPILRRIRLANHLDVRLYSHALFLFQSRVRATRNARLDDVVVPQSGNVRLDLDLVNAELNLKDEKMAPPSAVQKVTNNKDVNIDKTMNADIVIESQSDNNDNDDDDNVGDADGADDNNYREGDVIPQADDKTKNSKSVPALGKREGSFDSNDLLKFINAVKERKVTGGGKQESSKVVGRYAGEGEAAQKSSLDLKSYNARPTVIGQFKPRSMDIGNMDKSVTSVDPVDDENEELMDFLRNTRDDGEKIENSWKDVDLLTDEIPVKSIDSGNMESYGQNWLKTNSFKSLPGVLDKRDRNFDFKYLGMSAEIPHDKWPPRVNQVPDENAGLENGFGDRGLPRFPAKSDTYDSSLEADDRKFPTDTEDVETFLSHLSHLKQRQQAERHEQQQQQQYQQQQRYQQQVLEQHQQHQQQLLEQQQQQHQRYQQQALKLQQQPFKQQEQRQQQQEQYQQQPHGQQQLYQQHQREIQQQYLPAQQLTKPAGSNTPIDSPSKGANPHSSASLSNIYFQLEQPKARFSGRLPSANSESRFKEKRALDVAKVQRMFV